MKAKVRKAFRTVQEKLDEVSDPKAMSKLEYKELLEELAGYMNDCLDCVLDELAEAEVAK